MFVANTFVEGPPNCHITYYEIGSNPHAERTYRNFAQLDLVLVPRSWARAVVDVKSCMGEALATHHFLVEAAVSLQVDKPPRKDPPARFDRTALNNEDVAQRFAAEFAAAITQDVCSTRTQEPPRLLGPAEYIRQHTPCMRPGTPQSTGDLDSLWASAEQAFQRAAAKTLPTLPVKATKPWISAATLHLIQSRNVARTARDYDAERECNKRIRWSARADRRRWLEDLAATGDWSQVRRLRKNPKPQQGRLKDSAGHVVRSDRRAETMAEYLEKVQWAVRPVTTNRYGENLGEELPVECGRITELEIRRAARRLKNNRASGLDDVPAELRKGILCQTGPASTWAIKLYNECWERRAVPEAWHMSRVAAIFKKGDPAQCENYRPISLLPVGYKLFATILLQRLKDAGAEDRIWPTQFGFRSKCGTSDALFLARRLIDRTCDSKDESAVLLALDWAKAFDSIDPNALTRALIRFGVPKPFVDIGAWHLL